MFDGGGAEVALFQALHEVVDLGVFDGVDFLLAEKRHEVVLEAGHVGAVDAGGGGAGGGLEEGVTDCREGFVFIAGLRLGGVDEDGFVELDGEGFGGFERFGFGGLDLVLAVVVQADPVVAGGGGFEEGEFGGVAVDGGHRRGDRREAVFWNGSSSRRQGGGSGCFGHKSGGGLRGAGDFYTDFYTFCQNSGKADMSYWNVLIQYVSASISLMQPLSNNDVEV